MLSLDGCQVLLVESPVCRSLLPAARAGHCSVCWAAVPAPLPCPACTAALHCGLECRIRDTRHTLLCGQEELLDIAGEEAKLVLDMFITFGLQQFLALPKYDPIICLLGHSHPSGIRTRSSE
jgi:hypothetical protein